MAKKLINTEVKMGSRTLLTEAIATAIHQEALAVNTDLNSISDFGVYFANSSAIGTLVNRPPGSFGILIVIPRFPGADMKFQICLNQSGQMFSRVGIGSTWTVWQ